MFSYILFDLDGTISDPKLGITSCVQYALRSFGIEEPDLDRLEPFIGPPLRDSFMRFYDFTPEQAQNAIDKYRERFTAVGKFENELYPGMAELLRDLKAAGAHLAIASSKPGVFVEEILIHFGIRQYFDIVVGCELNGTREKKEEVLEEVMRQLRQSGAYTKEEIVMIGDRKFDVDGAKQYSIHSIAVTYGYAQPGELEAAEPDILVRSVAGLRQVLLGQPMQRQKTISPGNTASSVQPMPKSFRSASVVGRESKAKRGIRALGMSALALGTYFLVNLVVAMIVMVAGMSLTANDMTAGVSSEDFWLSAGNAAGILVGFAACFGLWKQHIQIKPVKRIDGLSVIPLVILSASAAMGLNGAITLSELYKYSPAFQEVARQQTQTPVWLGIIAFGFLAPLGEEIVFRGLVYGNLKKVFPIPAAILVSGLLFGLFHGNLVQGVYATLLGVIFALGYELYGTILVPVGMHAIANLFVYLLLDCTEFGAAFVTVLPCIVMLITAAVSFVLMVRWQKQGN